MVQYQDNRLFIYNSCISLLVGFVVGLFFFGVCLLYLFITKELAWWQWLLAIVGMAMGFFYLVLNLMGWYKKVKRLPVAYCDEERIMRLHLGAWEVPLSEVESVHISEVGRGKYISIVLYNGEHKALIESNFFVGDMKSIGQAIADHLATYRPARD